MIDEYVLNSAVEYLDQSIANGEGADLPGMLHHVDAYVRVLMVREEVLEALKQRPAVYAKRIDGRVIFTQSSGEYEITDEDLKENARMYEEELFRDTFIAFEQKYQQAPQDAFNLNIWAVTLTTRGRYSEAWEKVKLAEATPNGGNLDPRFLANLESKMPRPKD